MGIKQMAIRSRRNVKRGGKRMSRRMMRGGVCDADTPCDGTNCASRLEECMREENEEQLKGLVGTVAMGKAGLCRQATKDGQKPEDTAACTPFLDMLKAGKSSGGRRIRSQRRNRNKRQQRRSRNQSR